jgi:hypothetical protein
VRAGLESYLYPETETADPRLNELWRAPWFWGAHPSRVLAKASRCRELLPQKAPLKTNPQRKVRFGETGKPTRETRVLPSKFVCRYCRRDPLALKLAVLQFSALLFPTRSPDEFTTAIRTDRIHCCRAVAAECALITANISFVACREGEAAVFTYRFHFQRHFLSPLV